MIDPFNTFQGESNRIFREQAMKTDEQRRKDFQDSIHHAFEKPSIYDESDVTYSDKTVICEIDPVVINPDDIGHPSISYVGVTKRSCETVTEPENFFRSDKVSDDMMSLIDCAYDRMEIWNPNEKEELYNFKLRKAWLKRAKELGASPQ